MHFIDDTAAARARFRDELSLEQAADTLGENLMAQFEERGAKTLALTVKLRSARLVERMRRHLEGLTFKSTYNRDRVTALAALVSKLKSELKPLLIQTQCKLIELDFAEQELEAYRKAEHEIIAEREIKEHTGMYAEPARLIELLYDRHGITRDYFAALTEDDIAAISRILCERSGLYKSEEGQDQAAREARRF